MTDIVNPEYAVERLKILAEDIRKVAEWLRQHHPVSTRAGNGSG